MYTLTEALNDLEKKLKEIRTNALTLQSPNSSIDELTKIKELNAFIEKYRTFIGKNDIDFGQNIKEELQGHLLKYQGLNGSEYLSALAAVNLSETLSSSVAPSGESASGDSEKPTSSTPPPPPPPPVARTSLAQKPRGKTPVVPPEPSITSSATDEPPVAELSSTARDLLTSPKPPTGKPAAPLSDIRKMVRDLKANIREIEDVMPALSASERKMLRKKIDLIQTQINKIEELQRTNPSDLLEQSKLSYSEGWKVRQGIYSKYFTGEKDYIHTSFNNGNSTEPKWQKAFKAYEIEKAKYQTRLADIKALQEELDKQEDKLDEIKKITTATVKSEVIAAQESEIEALRLKIKLQRENAASPLVTLTKAHGGYPNIGSSTNRVRMYRGGEFGFETRVLSRSSAKELGFLKEKETGTMIFTGESSYTVNARLASTEVVVSTKTYPGDNQVVLVQEPGVVRDMSPEIKSNSMTEDQTEEMMNEKAIQMALMFAFNYKQGQPAIIRGGDPEVRKRAHAILLVLKHASDEGNVEMTMNYFLGKTLTRGVGWLQGKKIADIDLKGLQIHSNVGPQLYGSGSWVGPDDNGRLFGRIKDRASRHIHSVDYMQKQRDMEFVKQVFPKLSTDEIFKKQKKEFLDIRNQGANKKAQKDPDEVVLPSPKVPRK